MTEDDFIDVDPDPGQDTDRVVIDPQADVPTKPVPGWAAEAARLDDGARPPDDETCPECRGTALALVYTEPPAKMAEFREERWQRACVTFGIPKTRWYWCPVERIFSVVGRVRIRVEDS